MTAALNVNESMVKNEQSQVLISRSGRSRCCEEVIAFLCVIVNDKRKDFVARGFARPLILILSHRCSLCFLFIYYRTTPHVQALWLASPIFIGGDLKRVHLFKTRKATIVY